MKNLQQQQQQRSLKTKSKCVLLEQTKLTKGAKRFQVNMYI